MEFKIWLEATATQSSLDQEVLGVLWNLPEVVKMIRSGMWDGKSELDDRQKRIVISSLDNSIRFLNRHMQSPSTAAYYADPSKNEEMKRTLARMQRVLFQLQGKPEPVTSEPRQQRGVMNQRLTCPYCGSSVDTPVGAIRTRCPKCRQAFFTKDAQP